MVLRDFTLKYFVMSVMLGCEEGMEVVDIWVIITLFAKKLSILIKVCVKAVWVKLVFALLAHHQLSFLMTGKALYFHLNLSF